ncbi:hypothetical protein LPB86_15765 [Pedobacter sp. MC2016-14]|uniref:hypothetical protein n=1 Tax=Pedobacter sp. MC2016-14 TaxID=2897327 RepID=UPI001E345C22|nr:hypothetical protein [Pedobacter sp. MC2016-14]MCD0489699.1 hypothetical protein [Pedobacter sp. MC2016-14]
MNIIYNETRKQELILKHLLPVLGYTIDVKGEEMQDLLCNCKLIEASAYEILEVPGNRSEGVLWFPIHAMSHFYYYNQEHNIHTGIRIWNRKDVILDPDSLFEDNKRKYTLQILENSEVLSISYTNLDYLMQKYKDMERAIINISVNCTLYAQNKLYLLYRPELERIDQFRRENYLFTICASLEIQAMHLNIKSKAYLDYANKLNDVN